MKPKTHLYKYFQALSLDVVLGAAVFSLAISKYYQVKISWSALICQSIAIWLIYTFDHLLDAKNTVGDPSTYRHRFHKKNKKSLLVGSIIASIFGCINLFFLPPTIFKTGVIGFSLVLIYFFISHKLHFWNKEICVSVLYTFGIFISPFCSLQNYLQPIQYILIFQIFLIVFANLVLFSWFDVIKDRKDGHPSMVTHFGTKKAETLIKLLLLTGITINIILLLLHFNSSTFVMQLILLPMYVFLILLFIKDNLFRANDLYRAIGDGIFFIPALFLLYEATK